MNGQAVVNAETDTVPGAASWPVRSGAVPALANGYSRRPETAPDLAAALRAGARGVTAVGFGDLDLADLLSPPVTVLSYDPVLIGRTAGERLLQRLSGDRTPSRLVKVPVRLIARD